MKASSALINAQPDGLYYNQLMIEPGSPPVWVDTQDALKHMTEQLLQTDRIAVDTESNGLHAFQEKLCLMQFSIPGFDFLVDVITLVDLTPLRTLFSSKEHLKIFHAAEYDIICLKRDFQFEICHIFDTMMAARILGSKEFGLDRVLQAEFGIEIDKHLQKSNWAKRPLTEEQRLYARLDTFYLPLLHKLYEDRLKQAGLFELANEDFARLTRVCAGTPSTIEEQFWKVNGVKDMEARQQAALYELLKWRESKAQQLDRPSFKVISVEMLSKIATDLPASQSALRTEAGVPERLADQYGREILGCIQNCGNKLTIKPPRYEKMDKIAHKRLDALKSFRKEEGIRRKVDSDIILPRELMLELVFHPPGSMDLLRKQMNDYPWRWEHFGKQIMDTLSDERNQPT